MKALIDHETSNLELLPDNSTEWYALEKWIKANKGMLVTPYQDTDKLKFANYVLARIETVSSN